MKTSLASTRQSGVALVTVMVILLLSIIAVLAAARSGLLNEALVGNETDYSRALAAAEALVRDAEFDIRGHLPNGYLCRSDVVGGKEPTANFVGCRDRSGVNPWFPEMDEDLDTVRDRAAAAAATPCVNGICVPASIATLAAFEDNPTTMAAMAARGVRYGTHTRFGATPFSATTKDTNAILVGNPAVVAAPGPQASSQGWYWVEIFKLNVNAPLPTHNALQISNPDARTPFIYRITAVAMGQKAGTRAVIRSFFVPNPRNQNP
jgi:type IV pilus assembly protein PilX